MSLEILNLSLEKSPNSTLSLEEKSPNSTLSVCVCVFFNFVFFPKKMSLEILNLSLEKSPNSTLSLEKSPNSSPNSFFSEKKTKLKKKNTLRLRGSLENSPNSRVEFGDFPELKFKRNKIWKHVYFSKNKMSLENSPNSSAEFGEFCKLRFKRVFSEFGEFSKLKSWVWRIIQTQGLSWVWRFSPNSRVELRIKRKNLRFFSKNAFGKFSKSSFKKSLENSPNPGAKSPNSFVPEKMNWRKENKLRGSEVLKISNVQVQTHFLLKTMHTEKKTQRLRLSPVWVQKVVRVSREQNFATRKQLYSWESSREEFSKLCCQNLQAYMWPARLYCCCFCKWKKLSKLSKLLRLCVWRIP